MWQCNLPPSVQPTAGRRNRIARRSRKEDWTQDPPCHVSELFRTIIRMDHKGAAGKHQCMLPVASTENNHLAADRMEFDPGLRWWPMRFALDGDLEVILRGSARTHQMPSCFRRALLLAVSAGDLPLRLSHRSKSFMRTWCMTVGSFTTTVTGVSPVPISATQSFWRKMIRAFATAS